MLSAWLVLGATADQSFPAALGWLWPRSQDPNLYLNNAPPVITVIGRSTNPTCCVFSLLSCTTHVQVPVLAEIGSKWISWFAEVRSLSITGLYDGKCWCCTAGPCSSQLLLKEMHEMSRSLLLRASSKLPTVFRSYGRLFNKNFLFSWGLSLSRNAGSGIHQTCKRYRARPTVYHIMPSIGCCCERLQWAALHPASRTTS